MTLGSAMQPGSHIGCRCIALHQTRTGFYEVLLPCNFRITCNFQSLILLFFFQYSEILLMTKKGTEKTAVPWWALGKSCLLQWEHAVITQIEILLPKNTSRPASASQPEPLILTCSCLLSGNNKHITATTERAFRALRNQARIFLLFSIPSVTKQFVAFTYSLLLQRCKT